MKYSYLVVFNFRGEDLLMKGYVFHYYKYAQYIEQRDVNVKDDNQAQDYITFGEYDRVAIAQIDDFSRFRDLFKHASMWQGKRRSVLLYEIETEKESKWPLRITSNTGESDNFGFQFSNEKKNITGKLFLGLTILSVSDKIRCSSNYTEILKEIRITILKYLDGVKQKEGSQKTGNVEYEVFGTLGSSGVAILWFADQYQTILSLVEELGKIYVMNESSGENCFLTLYTLLSKNRLPEQCDKIEAITGQGILFFSLNKRMRFEEFNTFLKSIFGEKYNEANLKHCVGEYDYCYQVEIKDIYSKFDTLRTEEKIRAQLSINNALYKEYVSRTKLVFQETKDNELCETSSNSNVETGIKLDIKLDTKGKSFTGTNLNGEFYNAAVTKQYQALRFHLKRGFPHTAGMVDTLDLLYSDYKSNYNPKEYIWSPDFNIQFETILNHLCDAYLMADLDKKGDSVSKGTSEVKEILDAKEVLATKEISDNSPREYILDNEDYLNRIRDLTNALNQQIYHMFDSSRMYLEVPPCHLRYTGQHDMILYAYFGVVKHILSILYKVPRNSYQPELIPLITIDIVPTIQTVFYTDIVKYNERRIVNISLPSVSLFDFPTYIAYTVHEIFHYSAPENRGLRNKYYLLMLCSEFFVKVVSRAVQLSVLSEEECKNATINSDVWEKYSLDEDAIVIIRKHCFNYLAGKIDEVFIELENFFATKNINNFLLLDHLMKETIIIFEQMVYDSEVEYKGIADQIKGIFVGFFNEKGKVGRSEHLYRELTENSKIKEWVQGELLEEKFKEHFLLGTAIIERAFELEILEKSIDNVYADTINAFREVSADIAMVDLCKMNLVEYVFQHIRSKNDLLQKSNDGIKSREVIRIGMMIDYLINKDMKLSDYKAEFILRYITYYLTVKDDPNIDMKPKISRLNAQANTWFEDFIKKAYFTYKTFYSMYACELFPDIIEQYRLKDHFSSIFYEKCNYEKYKAIFGECQKVIAQFMENEASHEDLIKARKAYNSDLFQLNVEIIQRFQNQTTLRDLQRFINESADKQKTKEIPSLNGRYTFDLSTAGIYDTIIGVNRIKKVYGLQQLMQTLLEYANELKASQKRFYNDEKSEIWYRGHELSTWTLIPNLMRPEKVTKEGDNVKQKTLPMKQRENVEKFKTIYRSIDSIESFKVMENIDIITIMQHYGAKTNLLDWSEDAMSALYFALRNIVDPNIDKMDSETWKEWKGKPAELFLFSPLIYNNAMRKMLKYEQKKRQKRSMFPNKKRELLKDLENHLIEVWGSDIPNISMEEYGEFYKAYITGDIVEEQMLNKIFSSEKYDGKGPMPFLPLAILTSRINPRIKAQCGRFLAFNLYARMDESMDSKSAYEYLDLNRLQEKFIEEYREMGCEDLRECIFLYRIILPDEEVKVRVANWLNAIGMRDDRIYPELVNAVKKYN